MNKFQADAPGRVNLIGEHTDYHDGFVLPCAVPQRTEASIELRSDRYVHARSTAAELEPISYEIGHERRAHHWGDYVQGLTWGLAKQGFQISGFDLAIQSQVPVGSGLSSSAALEVAILRALRAAFDLTLSDVRLARTAQLAEVEFVGAPVGIMDQMASSLAGEREALFLDTRSLFFKRIPFPVGLELIVINSGITHRHTESGYATRRRESEVAAQRLGVRRLRDATPAMLDALGTLPVELARRARHVITENARVLEACLALSMGDLVRLGELFSESHRSMRDDYEISLPAIDLLVELAEQQTGVFGARLTGGGFGGAVVIAAAREVAVSLAQQLSALYMQQSGLPATILLPVGINPS